jgi:hypothetical protein
VRTSKEYRIAVPREGWSGGIDELAEIVGLRFGVPAIRARISLQRDGRFDVPGQGALNDAQRVADELATAGVRCVLIEVAAAAAADPVPVETVVAARGDGTLAPGADPRDGGPPELVSTLLGMPGTAGAGSTFVSGRGPGVIPDVVSEGEPAAQEDPVPDAWRTALGGAPAAPPVPAADVAQLPSTVPHAASAPGAAPARAPAPAPVAPPPPIAGVGPALAELDHLSAPSDTVITPAGDRDGWSAVLGGAIRAPAVDLDPTTLPDLPPPGARPPAPLAVPPPAERPASAASPAPRPPERVRDEEPTRLVIPQRADRGQEPLRELPPHRRFERLRPSETASAQGSGHSAVLAGVWSLVAPGAGQVYNGQSRRALMFALGAPLVVPWLWSVADAVFVGQRIADSRRPPPPDSTVARLAHVAAFWGLLMLALVVFPALRPAPAAPTSEGPVMLAPAPEPLRPNSAAPGPGTEPTPRPEIDEQPATDRAERQAQVDALLAMARSACADERFIECRRLATEALELDESSREAQFVHARAVAGLFAVDVDAGSGSGAEAP